MYKMWTPAHATDREFWLQWLNKYRSLKCLWDEDEKTQTDRNTRNAAYEELAEMVRIIAPDANLLFVKNRIASFRTCFRRENKKVKAAKANGATYKPSLFYYDALKFLDPDDEEVNDTWDTGYSEDEDPFNNVSSTKPPETAKQSPVKRKPETQRPYNNDMERYDDGEESDGTTETSNPMSKRAKKDEYDILGRRIAEHFRKMDAEQSLIAEKIISEVCIYGRMKALTMQTGLNIESPTVSCPREGSPRKEEAEPYYEDTGYA